MRETIFIYTCDRCREKVEYVSSYWWGLIKMDSHSYSSGSSYPENSTDLCESCLSTVQEKVDKIYKEIE